MSKTLAYTRVSTERQAQTGTSLPDNIAKCAQYGGFKELPGHEALTVVAETLADSLKSLESQGLQAVKMDKVVMGALRENNTCIFVDAGVTSDIPLMQRPAGMALCMALQEGDHLIIPLFDRAFRSSSDVESAMTFFRSKGVKVHILDMNIDTSTIMGECMLEIMAAVKRLDKRTIRARIAAGQRWAMANGRPPRACPLGWKHSDRKIGRYKKLVPDREYRALADMILKMSESGMSDRRVWLELLAKGKKNKRGAEWSLGAVQRARRAAKAGYPSKYDVKPAPSGAIIDAVPEPAITGEVA